MLFRRNTVTFGQKLSDSSIDINRMCLQDPFQNVDPITEELNVKFWSWPPPILFRNSIPASKRPIYASRTRRPPSVTLYRVNTENAHCNVCNGKHLCPTSATLFASSSGVLSFPAPRSCTICRFRVHCRDSDLRYCDSLAAEGAEEWQPTREETNANEANTGTRDDWHYLD